MTNHRNCRNPSAAGQSHSSTDPAAAAATAAVPRATLAKRSSAGRCARRDQSGEI